MGNAYCVEIFCLLRTVVDLKAVRESCQFGRACSGVVHFLQIHAEGGRYIGRALRSNASLVSLNLRLNRLTDQGGRMLIEGLHDNPTLACLNLRYWHT